MNDKPKSPAKIAAILVFLLLVIIICVVVLVVRSCPPIPIPAGQPAPSAPPPVAAPEVQPIAPVEMTSAKPDLGVKGVSL